MPAADVAGAVQEELLTRLGLKAVTVPGDVAEIPTTAAEVDDWLLQQALEHAGSAITDLPAKDLVAVQALLTKAIYGGWSAARLAKRLGSVVGLSKRYRQAVENYEQGLIDRGMSASEAGEKADAYASRLTKHRAKVIANHEVRKTIMDAQRATWRQQQEDGELSKYAVRIFRTHKDEKRCPMCKRVNGRRMTLKDDRHAPPLHPNCRCWEELSDQGIKKGVNNPTQAEISKHLPGMHDQRRHGRGGWKSFMKNRVLNRGGFSVYHPTGYEPRKGWDKGYMVSLAGSERRWSLDEITANDIRNFIRRNKKLLGQENYYLGGWYDNGLLYLDVSYRYHKEDEASRAAQDHKQLAYFDISTGDVVETGLRKDDPPTYIPLDKDADPEDIWRALVTAALELQGKVEKVRRVRTPEGSRRYGLPIGAIITGEPNPELPKRRKRGNVGPDITHLDAEEAFFNRFTKGTQHEFDESERMENTKDDARAYTKAQVNKAVRARIRQQEGWEEAIDGVDFDTGDLASKVGERFHTIRYWQQEDPERNVQDIRAVLQEVWNEHVGIDTVATYKNVGKVNRRELTRIQTEWEKPYKDLKAKAESLGGDSQYFLADWEQKWIEAFFSGGHFEDEAWGHYGGEDFSGLEDLDDMDAAAMASRAYQIGRSLQIWSNTEGNRNTIPAIDHFVWSNAFSTDRFPASWPRIPAEMQESYEDFPDENYEETFRQVKLAVLARHYIDTWAASSADSNDSSIALQRSLAEWMQNEFGDNGDLSAVKGYADSGLPHQKDSWDRSAELLATHKPFLQRFAAAMYDETQQAFADKVIKSVRIYRGMHFDDRPSWWPVEEPPSPQRISTIQRWSQQQEGTLTDIELVMNPASSWSADEETARSFARWEYGTGFHAVLTADIPVTDIFSTAVSGLGALHEAEVVTLGFPIEPVRVEWMQR